MSITLTQVTRRFGNFAAVDNVSLDIAPGELVALLGPSGSGKTTLLRIIGGLEASDSGRIHINGHDATVQDPKSRRVGFVFQHYALFRHMSVFENIAFGLRVGPRGQRPAESEIKARVTHLLSLVQLDTLQDRYPNQLSGGQRQRVALARALATNPSVLLLDEPFGALDTKVRRDLRRWLRQLQAEMKITTVFVTHDQEEALELADRVAILHQGRIQQVGTPTEVYDHPANAFICDFLGGANRVPCRVADGHAEFWGLRVPVAQAAAPAGAGYAAIRSHQIRLVPVAPDAPHSARIVSVAAIGPQTKLDLAVGDDRVEAILDRGQVPDSALVVGSTWQLGVERVHVLAN